MNKAHRDRIAFMRICSGKFDANMEVRHVQGNKVMRLSQPQQIMADERKILNEAYAGDIIGVFRSRHFLHRRYPVHAQEKFQYEGIPTFAPEHFARVRQVDTMKRKTVRQGRRADRPGRCYSDLSGVQYRSGRDHRRCGRRAAVRCTEIPSGERI